MKDISHTFSHYPTPSVSKKNIRPRDTVNHLSAIAGTPLLTQDEEYELGRRVMQGDDHASRVLVERNLRLVLKIAHRFKDDTQSLDDLVAEGTIGLMRAATLFNPDKGAKFSTYAGQWITQSICRFLWRSRNAIRVPEAKQINLRKIRRAESWLQSSLGRDPTIEELSEKTSLSPQEITEAHQANISMQSLHANPADQDNDRQEGIINLLEDCHTPSASDMVVKNEAVTRMLAALNLLNDRELVIIGQRFGLIGAAPASLREIAEGLSLSHERVRQIEEWALIRVRRKLSQWEDEAGSMREINLEAEMQLALKRMQDLSSKQKISHFPEGAKIAQQRAAKTQALPKAA